MRVIDLYDRVVLERPAASLAVLLGLFALCGWGARDFRLDASADSLILENDEDLRYYREISAGYETQDFLVMTYSPRAGGLFSEGELARLKALREDLSRLEPVSSVVTILDVPLLRSPPITLKDLRDGIRTLESPGVDAALARTEFAESPVYRNLLVSPDLGSTALLINLRRDEGFEALAARRLALREKRRTAGLSPEEKAELKDATARYRAGKDANRRDRHRDIKAVRALMDRYRPDVDLFLGGAPMVVDDMVSFVKSDISIFGAGVLVFLVVTLWAIFRRVRWVLLPLFCCASAAVVMVGLLGFANLEVTVVSSNFISLQLIMTMSFAIHIIGRYQEIGHEDPGLEARAHIKEAVRTIFHPSSFSCLTTIVGFASLLVCDIKPVVDFGWMMSAGLAISLAVTFLLLPVCLRFLPKLPPSQRGEAGIPVTAFFARVTERGRWPILLLSALVITATGVGMSRLTVENSFINYFKDNTEIHRGMKVIDRELGGTTPLDVVLRFDGPAAAPAPAPGGAAEDPDFALLEEPSAASGDADFDLLEDDGGGDAARYWFTADKLAEIEKVHDHLQEQEASGKVLSLATVLKMMRQLEGVGEHPDNFELALIFNEFPARFKRILVDPFVSVERDEARLMVRMKDSLPSLRRDEFLKRMRAELQEKLGLEPDRFRLTGLMVLYNNMLQSLYESQIKASSLTVLPVFLMFLFAFRSLRTALIAMAPNLIATTLVLGAMGLAGLPLDMMTITIVSIGLGMGVEDTILYIHRFRLEIRQDWDYWATMRRCHLTVGNPMYYTSVVVTLGFSILALSNFIPTILFGLLTAATMIIALVSALTLLPTLIVLLKPFGTGRPL